MGIAGMHFDQDLVKDSMGQTVKIYENKLFSINNNLMNQRQMEGTVKPPLGPSKLPDEMENEIKRLDIGKVKNIRQSMEAQLAARKLQKDKSVPSIAKQSFTKGSVEKIVEEMGRRK